MHMHGAAWTNRQIEAKRERGMKSLRRKGKDSDINIIRSKHYAKYTKITKGKTVNPVTSFK